MAFNVGPSRKDIFKKLKKLTPRQRLDYVNKSDQGPATILTMLTPAQFAELFPNYFRKGLPDVSGFRDAISKKTLQKQDDINFGLSQGATDIKQAEQMGTWRRRLGGGGSTESVTSSGGGPVTLPVGSARGKYTPSQAAALIRKAGGTKEEARILGAIAMPESSGYPWKHNGNANTGDDSYGLWQINVLGKLGPDRRRLLGLAADGSEDRKLLDPNLNAKAALMLLRGQLGGPGGYQHWTTYKNGLHSKYLSSAEAGVSGDVDMPQTSKDFDTVSKKSTKSGGVYGDGECVALSKSFSNLGPASQWKFKEGAAIVPGSIIATTSYGKGEHPGGVHHNQTPDKKSHYHTGVALTAPNSNGDVLILEQFVGQPARVAMVNINNYRGSGERMAVVEGGEPTAKSMQAVELGKQLANPDQLPWIQSGSGGEMQQTANKPNVEVKPVQEAPTPIAKPAATSTEQLQQYPADQQQTAGIANPQTAKVEKVDKSKKTTETYKFDTDKYWTEVKTKQPMADSMFYGKDKVMQETYQGFEEAQAAGAIKWNKKTNEIQILDPNHEKIKDIYNKMQENNIDRNAFLTKTEAGGAGTAKVHKGHKNAAPSVETYDGFLPDLRHDIGSITGQFETGKYGSSASHGVETISSGKRDPGGVSYGRHQLSSKKGTMADFMKSKEAEPFQQQFSGLKPGTAKFSSVYARVAKQNPEAFDKAQHEFLARTHYTPFLKSAAKLGYNVEDPRVQEAIWGGGVQFRNNMRTILNRASHSVKGSVDDQVMALAQAKHTFAPKIKNRYEPEAQAILGIQPNVPKRPDINQANVMDMSKYDQYAMEQKSKKATFIAQHQTPDVKQEQVASGRRIDSYYEPRASASVEPGTSTKEVFERMRHLKADPIQRTQPNTSTGVTVAPPDVTRDTMQPVPKNDKNVMNMMQAPATSPQREVTIDPFLNRPPDRMPTQSLARAMQNTIDPNGAIDNRFGTNLGGMG